MPHRVRKALSPKADERRRDYRYVGVDEERIEGFETVDMGGGDTVTFEPPNRFRFGTRRGNQIFAASVTLP